MEQLTDRLFTVFSPLVEEHGLELVDVAWVAMPGGRRLGVVITRREGGVSLDDCEVVAQELEGVLESIPELVGAYTLEVSSPGLDRVLKRKAEYDIFRGRTASLRLRSPIDGKYELRGVLQGLSGDHVEVLGSSGVYTVGLDNVKKAKLIFEMK